MKIIDAINAINSLQSNRFSNSDKVKWLSALDSLVKTNIIDTHDGGADIPFSPYDDNTSLDTELLIPSPHEQIYLLWLESKINYYNAEYQKYNNSVTMFNTEYKAFERLYNRNHMPKSTKLKLF